MSGAIPAHELWDALLRVAGSERVRVETGRSQAAGISLRSCHVTVERGAVALLCGPESRIAVVIGPGQCFGPTVAEDGVVSHLLALAPSVLIKVPIWGYERALAADARLARTVLRIKAVQHARLVRWLTSLRRRHPAAKLAGTLAYLADQAGERCLLAGNTHFRLSQRHIADMAGLSRQTTNEIIGVLGRARVLYAERGFICILRRDVLDRLSVGEGLPSAPRTGVGIHCHWRHPEDAFDCVPLRRAPGRAAP